MKLEYTLTLQDYKAAYRLHRRQNLARRIVPWIGPVLLLTAVAGFVSFSINKNSQGAGDCISLAAGAFVVTVGSPISRFINIRKGFRRLFPPGETERTSLISLNEEGIIREHAGASELKIQWGAIFGWAQDEKVTMIYTNKDCFLVFPTRVMSSAQRKEFIEFVTRHVVKR